MAQLILSDRFRKNLRDFLRKHPELRATIKERFEILEQNPGDPRLKTHKLTGKLKGFLAASVTFEYRIVFRVGKDTIFLFAIGSHEEVY